MIELSKGRIHPPLNREDIPTSQVVTGASQYPVGKLISGIVIDRVAAIRAVLALSALVIVGLESPRSNTSSGTLKIVLACYTVYSVLLCLSMLRQNRFRVRAESWSPWLDVAWFTALFALGVETSSIFYFGFFFAIIGASFRQGFNAGMGITISSCLSLIVVGYLIIPTGHELGLSRFLLRPLFLLMVGYMVAHWGGSELKLKRRLLLLKEISKLSNPRFGVDRTVGFVMEQLRTFFYADTCVVVTFDEVTSTYALRRTYNKSPEKGEVQEGISQEFAQLLLSLGERSAVVFRPAMRPLGLRLRTDCYEYDLISRRRTSFECEKISAVAANLDANSFISVPVGQKYQTVGRIFLTRNRRLSSFGNSDIDFLYQVLEHVMPVLENIRLVDRMATDAAEHERQRIAFDIHDTVIQPYIGLQMGLAAIRQKIQNGGSNVAGDVEHLRKLTEHGISHLRDYVSGLKSNGNGTTSLETAVRRFASKYSVATGIDVQVVFETETPHRVNDRLTAEVFQMVAEGLSNIRRHTRSSYVRVAIGIRDGVFTLRIENDGKPESSAAFQPRSLTERTVSLGGTIEIGQTEVDRTLVNIQIPL